MQWWWSRQSRFAGTRPKSVLLTWWGSFPGGRGATLGDYHAVANVARWLRDREIAHQIVNGTSAAFPADQVVGPDARDDGKHSVLAFVCGPLSLTRGMRRMLREFRDLRKIAVGVSVIEPDLAGPYYDTVVARDSSAGTTFDLALAFGDVDPKLPLPNKSELALCLRGMQKTYGKENCLSDIVDELLAATALVKDRAPPKLIDTEIAPGNNVSSIENAFATSSIVCTTRMHGALFSLLSRVPFIAIDQIRGGAKVSRLMREVGWRWSFLAESLRVEDIDRALDEFTALGWTDDMEARRTHAIALSQAALDTAGQAIVDALG